MALIDKLVAIANGFRSSRGTSAKLSLDEMAALAAEPVGGSTEPSEWKQQFISAIERDDSKPVTKLPDGLTKIGDSSFSGSGAIMVTSIPPGVEEIEYRAFYSCYNLVNISLPDGLKRIGSEAFAYCYALSSVTFKGKVTTIGTNSFVSCINLLTINVPWAEGEVEGAPWGATKATINYNYTVEE